MAIKFKFDLDRISITSSNAFQLFYYSGFNSGCKSRFISFFDLIVTTIKEVSDKQVICRRVEHECFMKTCLPKTLQD